MTIESGGWKIQSAPFIIVDDQKANIIGRNLLPKIGVKLIQETNEQALLNIHEQEESIQILNNGSMITSNNYAYVS